MKHLILIFTVVSFLPKLLAQKIEPQTKQFTSNLWRPPGEHNQINDKAIEPLMEHRMFSCYEVEYNSILAAQRLYTEHKNDTLTSLVNFWKSHCDVNERLFTLSLLVAIQNNDFKEYMSENEFLKPRIQHTLSDSNVYQKQILYYMKEYRKASIGAFSDAKYYEWQYDNYPLPKDYNDYYNFYKKYYAFLRDMAASLQGKRVYSPTENYLLRFYSNPDSTAYTELDSNIYNGTILQSNYLGYKKYMDDIHGFNVGVDMGLWIPTGTLNLLGSHPSIGGRIGGRSDRILFDYLLGFRFISSPNNFVVQKDDSLYLSHEYLAWYTGLDFGIKLLKKNKHELDLMMGTGYDEISILFVDGQNNNPATTKSISSMYANAGFAYRFYFYNGVIKERQRRRYVSLQARYSVANYHNDGGTPMTGNTINVGIIYGGFSHGFDKYPYLK